MKSCKFYIVWVYKNIKSIESIINDEIRAQHDCVSYYDDFNNITRTSLEHYVIIKRQIKGLIRKNIIDDKFKDLYVHIRSLVKEIDAGAIEFDKSYRNKNIPFVSKRFKMKQIFELNLTLLQTMNIMLIKIYDLNNALMNYTNRLKYISAIITDINAEINILGIQINDKDKNELHLVDQDIFKLEKLIFSPVKDYPAINDSFKIIESKMVLIFDIIGSKKTAIYIIKNLLDHFASKRKFNNNFNYKMSLAEKQYLSGEYIRALNTIITANWGCEIMYNKILVRYGELTLKGKNRYSFINQLEKNMKKIHGLFPVVTFDRMYLSYTKENIEEMKHVVGISSYSPVIEIETNYELIKNTLIKMTKDLEGSFKIKARRSYKKFPKNSNEINNEMGGVVLDNSKLIVNIKKTKIFNWNWNTWKRNLYIFWKDSWYWWISCWYKWKSFTFNFRRNWFTCCSFWIN